MALRDEIKAGILSGSQPTSEPSFVPTTRTNAPVVTLSPPDPTPATTAASEQAKFSLGGTMRFLGNALRTPFSFDLQQNAPPEAVTMTPALGFDERNQRLDAEGQTIELDRNATIDKSDYWFAAVQRGPEAQMQVLQKFYPERAPRQLEDGTIVMQVTDGKTGAIKDVPINREGIDSHDLIDLAVQAPEIAAGVAAGVATGGVGAVATVGQLLAGALAANYVGQTRDVLARASAGIPLAPEEISRARNTDMYLDLFMGGALGAAGKSTRILSPFAGSGTTTPGSLEFNLARGQEFLKREFGLEFPATPGERTGSMALKAVEQAEGAQPGARSVIGKIKEQGRQTIRKLQALAGGQATPDETIGELAIDQLRNRVVLPLEDSLTKVREAAEAKGQTRILDMLDTAAGMKSSFPISSTTAGKATLKAFETRRLAAKKSVDEAYAKVREIPGGAGDVLSGDAAADAARAIREELPAVLKEVERDSGLVDEFGNAITDTVEERQLVKSGVPSNLMTTLSDLENLRGGRLSLQSLDKLKTEAYNEIARTEAVPGVKDRWFNMIAKAYESAIQTGIDETGDPALKAALTNARDTYKRELLPFDRPGVKEMARSEFDAGRLTPEQVTTRLFEGPRAIENFAMLKETLGANNTAFRVLKRAFVDRKLEQVTDTVTGRIDAGKLGDLLKSFGERPELAEEVFGKKFKELETAVRSQAALRQIDKLDATEVKVLLGSTNPGRQELATVMNMTKLRDDTYINSILKDVADGVPVTSRIQPTEFVNRLRNVNTPTKDVERILSALDEPTRDAIATSTFYDILERSSKKNASTASAALEGAPIDLDPTLLAHNLGRGGSPERLRNELLLGDKGVVPPRLSGERGPTRSEVLENIVKLQAPRETSSDAFRAAGSLASGKAVLDATRDPFRYATQFVKGMLTAIVYTSDKFKNLAANQVFTSAQSATLANALIASEPFLTRATEVMGPERAAAFIGNLKESIDKHVTSLMADTPESRQRNELEKFKQGEPAAVKVESESRQQMIDRIKRGE